MAGRTTALVWGDETRNMTGKSAIISEQTLDVRELVVSNQSFGPAEIKTLCKAISQDYAQLGVLRDAANELQQTTRTPAQSVRLGVRDSVFARSICRRQGNADAF